MATMHPPELPIAVLADASRRDEVVAFTLLAEHLDHEFSVFYRPTVNGASTETTKIPSFIILHPRHGLLGLTVATDHAPFSGHEPANYPYMPIRSAVRTMIFALKEQGIRFYIPAPCAVLFLHSQPAHYQAPSKDMEYTPLFPKETPDLQDRIKALMPINQGFVSTWRVPDAVEKISRLLQPNAPLRETSASAPIASSPAHSVTASNPAPSLNSQASSPTHASRTTEPARIVYMVRAIDIVLAVATLVAFIMVITLLPQGVVTTALDHVRSWIGTDATTTIMNSTRITPPSPPP